MPRQTSNDSRTDSTVTEQALADELGMDIGEDGTDIDVFQSFVSDLGDEVAPPVSSVLKLLVGTIDDL